MALLDYMFPMAQSNPSITGLLGEEEAKRIRQQSQVSGLLNFGANLLANSGPTSQPMSFGQRLAPALLGGYQAAQGATNQQIQEQLALQKAQREQGFRKAVEGAFTTQPLRTGGLTQTGPESQLGLLGRPEFGGGFADQETVSALRANPNLPTERTLDQSKFMSALAEYNPLEFAKMQMQAAKPGDDPLSKFKAFSNLSPADQQAYAAFASITAPKSTSTTNIIDKGPDELRKLDAKAVGDLSGKVNAAREFANTAGSIENLLTGKGGGEIVNVGANVAQFLGLDSKTADANALAKALQTRAATQVRAAGSGSTSDMEFRAFLSVFPSLANTEKGRSQMAQGLKFFADRDAKIERKARELFAENKYSASALAEYDASLGPVLPKDFGLTEANPSGSTGTQRRDFRSQNNR
jgi:hypothetical protein